MKIIVFQDSDALYHSHKKRFHQEIKNRFCKIYKPFLALKLPLYRIKLPMNLRNTLITNSDVL